jgi:hypothetical protein
MSKKKTVISEKQCPDRHTVHTQMPEDYFAWNLEAERRSSEGQKQEQCPTCGLWAVWVADNAHRANKSEP